MFLISTPHENNYSRFNKTKRTLAMRLSTKGVTFMGYIVYLRVYHVDDFPHYE